VFIGVGTEGTGSKIDLKKQAEVFKNIVKGAGIERNGLTIVFVSGVVSGAGTRLRSKRIGWAKAMARR